MKRLRSLVSLLGTRLDAVARGGRGEGGKWIYVNRGKILSSDPEILRDKAMEGEVHLYESKDHTDNFLTCIYDGKPTATPVEVSHRSISIAHLANVALRSSSSSLKWDPKT